MDMMWKVCFAFSLFFLIAKANGQLCKISNVQINDEEGRQQYIELNLKKVDTDCPGCNLSEDSKSGYHFSHKWTANPPIFNVLFTPGELILECDVDSSLPFGLCSKNISKTKSACSKDACSLLEVEELAEDIEERDLVPLSTGNKDLDHKVAVAIVHLNIGNLEKAIDDFTSIITSDPDTAVAYFGRGAAYVRKGLNSPKIGHQALYDFNKAIQLDKEVTRPDIFIHRAEVLMVLQHYQEAYNDASTAIEMNSLPKLYFFRGVLGLLLENFEEAEQDFRKNLQINDAQLQTLSHFYLGLALHYRGKIRNAVEVFKEVVKENPKHVEAMLSLAQGFKELGNIKAALTRFNQSLGLNPNLTMAYQLRGSMLFQYGDLQAALQDFEKCIELDPTNAKCLYMKGLTKISQGQIYDGIKDTTKLMVTDVPVMKASTEFMKSQYIREYARYIHARLDSPVSSIQPDEDFSEEYLSHWDRMKRFNFKNYKEQPGLRPDMHDVVPQYTIPSNLKSLLCQANALGKMSQVSVDGILPNKRLNLAMGLAAIHIAQYFENIWKIVKSTKANVQEKVVQSWRELFSIAVYYRRLATLDEPIFWVDKLPEYSSKEGYRSDIPFVRGSVTNFKVKPYYELAFKLAKTMLEHYSGDGAVQYHKLKEDIAKATTCEDLLNIARQRQINPHGFLVSTQVPSLFKIKDDFKLDGGVLLLTKDMSQKIVFALNVANIPDRTASYSAEMDHLVSLLQDEVKKLGSSRAADMDMIISHILSIVYYFYNLIPLTKGSGAVAYSVIMGLLMSVGRQITGRIPNGRMLDMEAILAGAPDAFVLVAKNWMMIKKSPVPVSTLPKVWEVLPTVRSVLEILSVNTTTC